MNLIAQQALARAKARPTPPPVEPKPQKPIVIVAKPLAKVDPVVQPRQVRTGPENRVLYLEGRRHAAEIVIAAGLTLNQPGGPTQVLATLRRSAEGKPPSFAKGVAEVVALLEQEVARG